MIKHYRVDLELNNINNGSGQPLIELTPELKEGTVQLSAGRRHSVTTLGLAFYAGQSYILPASRYYVATGRERLVT